MKNFLRKILSRLPWQSGRQNSGYYKLKLLISTRFLFDVYILKFPEGSYIDNHRDPVTNDFDHYRMNIVLIPAIRGGKFVIAGKAQEGRVHRFRPDKYTHKVTKIKEGTRYVLSIGWVRHSERKAA